MEEPVDITPYLDQLDESLRDKVLQLQKGRWVQLLSSASGGSAPGAPPATWWGGGEYGEGVEAPSAVWVGGYGLEEGQPRSPAHGSHSVGSEHKSL